MGRHLADTGKVQKDHGVDRTRRGPEGKGDTVRSLECHACMSLEGNGEPREVAERGGEVGRALDAQVPVSASVNHASSLSHTAIDKGAQAGAQAQMGLPGGWGGDT